MAPSVDKQSTKMVNILPSEEKPMEICSDVPEAAVFPRDYARYLKHEICKTTQILAHHDDSSYGSSTINSDDRLSDKSTPRHRDSYDQLHVACRCTFSTQQLVENNGEDTWYRDLMRGVVQGVIAINGGVDAIRQTPLQLSVRRGDYEMMERLLSVGANIDAHDATGKTALHLAAQLGDVRAAEILLRRRADLRAKTNRGFDPLTFAVQSGCTILVKMLLDHGCDVNQLVLDHDMKRQFSQLHNAIERNHIMMARLLLQCNADVNQRDSYGSTCLHFASRLGRSEIVQLLLAHGARVHEKSHNDLTALYFAVEAGHRDIFELLLSHGANLNDRGLGGATLLHYAIKNGDVELIDTLLHRGAHVDATNRFGKTPLHYAIAEKNWAALELLLEHGADVNSKDALGKTSLHTAIECCRKEIFELLLRRGADVNAEDNLLQTPLHFAVKQGCYATVELLLRHGADVNARDDAKQTPLHLAVRFGHVKLFEPMLRRCVDVNALDVNGQSPLHLAIVNEKLYYFHYEYTFFAQLLRSGAEVRSRTVTSGETPLHVAVRKRCLIFAKNLLSHGAEVDAVDSIDNKTSLRLAMENEDSECIEQLLTFGADLSRVALTRKTSQAVNRVFAQHFIRKIAAGMSVDADHMRIIPTDDETRRFSKQCEDEVTRMKATRLCNEQTYYDFLRGNRRCLVNFVANNKIQHAFDCEAHRNSFPIYADMLERNLSVGKRYAPVLEAASQRLYRLCRFQLPDVPAERILHFLDDRDMGNIVGAIPSLTNCS